MENRSTASDLELFTREINWDTRPVISKIAYPVFFGTCGFALAAFSNFLARRPLISGIQKHIAFTALGIPLGFYATKKLDERSAQRDAILIQYMKMHPEDFGAVERVKYSEVLQPWLPYR